MHQNFLRLLTTANPSITPAASNLEECVSIGKTGSSSGRPGGGGPPPCAEIACETIKKQQNTEVSFLMLIIQGDLC